jgi:hypothetical protein
MGSHRGGMRFEYGDLDDPRSKLAHEDFNSFESRCGQYVDRRFEIELGKRDGHADQ